MTNCFLPQHFLNSFLSRDFLVKQKTESFLTCAQGHWALELLISGILPTREGEQEGSMCQNRQGRISEDACEVKIYFRVPSTGTGLTLSTAE